MSDLQIGLLLGSLTPLICNLLCEPIRNRWRKQCNYDCSKCGVWDCNVHDCKKYKDKLESKVK